MPDVVHGDGPDVVVVTDAAKGAHQVAWLDWPAGACGEDEIGLGPRAAHVSPVAGLARALVFECLPGEAEYGQLALSGSALDGPKVQLAADSLELLPDVDGSRVEVDVSPAEPEAFAAPQAVGDEDDEGSV